MKIFLAFTLIVSIVNSSFKTNQIRKENLLKTKSLYLSRTYQNHLRITQEISLPTTYISPESTFLNETTKLEKYIILGFENISQPLVDQLKFYTYVKIININKNLPPLNSFSLKALVSEDEEKLRLLDDNTEVENITCINITEKEEGKVYKYNCNGAFNGSVNKIYLENNNIDNNNENSIILGPYFNKTQNLKNGKVIQMLSGNNIGMYNCQIKGQDNNIKIEGNTSNLLPNSDNLTLYVVTTNDELKEINCKSKSLNKDNNYYQLTCDSTSSFQAKLNNTYAKINDSNYIMLDFKDDDKVSFNYTQNTNGVHFPKKKSEGLSAGGIVAIVLPCVAALIAVAAVAFLLSKNTTVVPPPMRNLGNNTIGISSSTNAVK